MTWINEADKTIKFVSPRGKEFTPLWRENERSFEKKLGIFDPPKYKKSIVQDLDVKSVSYPLNVFFQGIRHYEDANDFFKCLFTERGQWAVTHPTKGFLSLQLVSCKEKIEPMSSGNYTEFETVWIEPANAEQTMSVEQSLQAALKRCLTAIDDAVTQLKQLRADVYSAVTNALNMINTITGFAKNIFSELIATVDLIKDLFDAALSTLETAADNMILTPADDAAQTALGEAVIDLIGIPVQVGDSYETRQAAYVEFLDSISTLAPKTVTINDFNQVIALELSISAALIAIAQISLTSNYTTRRDVVSAIENLTTVFNDSVNALETIQERFAGLDIDRQYFSQSTAYGTLQNLYALCVKYLLSLLLNVKIERKITLTRERSPLEITVTEYGALTDGVTDYYDLFLTSNNLSGNDILLLPAGREVVVYV